MSVDFPMDLIDPMSQVRVVSHLLAIKLLIHIIIISIDSLPMRIKSPPWVGSKFKSTQNLKLKRDGSRFFKF